MIHKKIHTYVIKNSYNKILILKIIIMIIYFSKERYNTYKHRYRVLWYSKYMATNHVIQFCTQNMNIRTSIGLIFG